MSWAGRYTNGILYYTIPYGILYHIREPHSPGYRQPAAPKAAAWNVLISRKHPETHREVNNPGHPQYCVTHSAPMYTPPAFCTVYAANQSVYMMITCLFNKSIHAYVQLLTPPATCTLVHLTLQLLDPVHHIDVDFEVHVGVVFAGAKAQTGHIHHVVLVAARGWRRVQMSIQLVQHLSQSLLRLLRGMQ